MCVCVCFFFLYSGGWSQSSPLGTAATNRPIVPAPGDYDDGEVGGMIGRGNRSARRKPSAVPLRPPQTSHAVRMRTRAAAVGSEQQSMGLLSSYLIDCSVIIEILFTFS
jgi:hypothetical protein